MIKILLIFFLLLRHEPGFARPTIDPSLMDVYFSKIKNCRSLYSSSKIKATACIQRSGISATELVAQNLTKMLFLPFQIGHLRACSEDFKKMAEKFEKKDAPLLCFDISDSQTKAEGLLVFSADPRLLWKIEKIKY